MQTNLETVQSNPIRVSSTKGYAMAKEAKKVQVDSEYLAWLEAGFGGHDSAMNQFKDEGFDRLLQAAAKEKWTLDALTSEAKAGGYSKQLGAMSFSALANLMAPKAATTAKAKGSRVRLSEEQKGQIQAAVADWLAKNKGWHAMKNIANGVASLQKKFNVADTSWKGRVKEGLNAAVEDGSAKASGEKAKTRYAAKAERSKAPA